MHCPYSWLSQLVEMFFDLNAFYMEAYPDKLINKKKRKAPKYLVLLLLVWLIILYKVTYKNTNIVKNIGISFHLRYWNDVTYLYHWNSAKFVSYFVVTDEWNFLCFQFMARNIYLFDILNRTLYPGNKRLCSGFPIMGLLSCGTSIAGDENCSWSVISPNHESMDHAVLREWISKFPQFTCDYE